VRGYWRVYRGGIARQPGFLTDYAFVINGLTDLYEASFDWHWLQIAGNLASDMIEKFGQNDEEGLYFTAANQSDLLIRQRDTHDGSVPSGTSMAAMALLRLAFYWTRRTFVKRDVCDLFMVAYVNRMPTAYTNLLNAYDFAVHRSKEIVFVEVEVIRILASYSFPAFDLSTQQTIGIARPYPFEHGGNRRFHSPRLKIGNDRHDRATAYVWKEFVCQITVSILTRVSSMKSVDREVRVPKQESPGGSRTLRTVACEIPLDFDGHFLRIQQVRSCKV